MSFKRTFNFLPVLLFISTIAFPQDNQNIAGQLLDMADEIYRSTSAYIQARDAYLQVLDYDPDNLKANYMAGRLYLETVNKEKATQYLVKAYSIKPDYTFDLLYLIGRSYQFGLDFDNAISYYNQYLDKISAQKGYKGADFVPADEVNQRIKECNTGKKLVASPLNYNITNVGDGVNSEWPDYGPTIDENETMLIFTSRRKQGNMNENVYDDNFPYEDIYISRKSGDTWGPAQNMGPVINTPYFESSLTLTKDGKQLYLYLDTNAGDIYVSNLKSDGSWSAPVPLEGNINSSYKETSVSISPDGNVIYFASDRPGSIGGLDLYYSIKNKRGLWLDIKNMGPIINTPEDDDFPFIDYDSKTLYFSSQGHDGMGGFDIYKSVYDSAKKDWISPVNIGYPMNTPDNDISFIATKDGKRGYFSSVREDGFGYQDIYMFTIPDEIRNINEENTKIAEKPVAATVQPVMIDLTVTDESGTALDAHVKIRNNGDKYLGPVTRVSTGTYSIKTIFDSDKSCTVTAELDGYIFASQNITVPGATAEQKNINLTLVLKKPEVGKSIILHNIYFDFDKATLKPESYIEINKLYQMLQENSKLIAEIAGYTDNIGTEDYNYRLSYRRAKAVVDYLIKKGMDPVRIHANGYGEEDPIASNDDEIDGRELNRRVEFHVMRYLY